MKDLPFTKEELQKLYESGLTCKEIGEMFNINKGKVLYHLKKMGMKPRPTGNIPGKEYHFKAYNRIEFDDKLLTDMYLSGVPMRIMRETFHCDAGPIWRRVRELGLVRSPEVLHKMQSTQKADTSKDEQIKQLYENGFSGPEISKIIGMSSSAVLNHLRRAGIETRTLSKSQFAKNKKEYPEDLNDYEKLYDMYVVRRMSKKDIGLQYNVDPGIIDSRLKRFGIKVRGNSESKKGLYIGDKHPNWKGGRTGIYLRLREYFYDNQVPFILKRDHYHCQMCGAKKKLQVHHIVPFKTIFDNILQEHPNLDIIKDEHELYDIMTHDDRLNDMNNLITYCKECHLFKVHKYKKQEKC